MLLFQDLSHPKIHDIEIAHFVNKYILRLEVPMHYATVMQMLQSQHQAPRKQSSLGPGAWPHLLQHVVQVNALDIIHEQVKELLIFEGLP